MTRRIALVALLAGGALAAPAARAAAAPPGCASAESPGGEWRSYGHDLANTRNQDHERAISDQDAATLAPAWTFSSSGAGGSGDFTGTPAVADKYSAAAK